MPDIGELARFERKMIGNAIRKNTRPFLRKDDRKRQVFRIRSLIGSAADQRMRAGEENQRFNTGDSSRMKFPGSIEVFGVKKIL